MLRQEWVIDLHGTNRVHQQDGKFAPGLVYILDTDDPQSIEAALAAAEPGQFVPVPVRPANGPTGYLFHVQPHAWGAWAVYLTLLNDSL